MERSQADRALAALQQFTADRTLSFLWVDRLGIVLDTFGQSVRPAWVGQFLNDVFPVFLGLEPDFAKLIHRPGESLDLPNISVVSDGSGPMQRLNVSVRWDPSDRNYVILVAKALSRAAFEIELQQQVRARRLAETMLVEQAESIQATNVELGRANQELANFARLVSHDLKSPMRAMRYVADDLESSLTDPSNADPKVHLDRLRAQSRRMTAMLSSLLAYASLDRLSVTVETVDTRALVEAIVGSLHRPGTLDLLVDGEWPAVQTRSAPLDIVLRNLIENAIQYAKPAHEHIRASCALRPGALLIVIEDNGAGIPEQHRQAVFNPFTRLEGDDHLAAEPEGHVGMGLALVQRAVQNVGGKVWVERETDPSSVYPGARFCVLWPIATPADG